MKSSLKQKQNFDELSSRIERGYAGLDTARASALEGLLRIREARAKLLHRESPAAAEPGDPAAPDNATRLAETNDRLIAVLQHEVVRAKTKLPARKPNAAVVHGYVRRAHPGKIEPVAHARVIVFAEGDQEPGQKLGEARTDDQGYYEILVPTKAASEKLASRGTKKSKTDPGRALVAVLSEAGKKPSTLQSVSLAANSLSFRELLIADDAITTVKNSSKRK